MHAALLLPLLSHFFYPSDETLEAKTPDNSLVRLGRMNTESRPEQRKPTTITQSVDNIIFQQHKKLQSVIIEDPLKWTASKLNYPMRRVNLNNPFENNSAKVTLADLKNELLKTEEGGENKEQQQHFHYQPIILTIRSTRQRYFLPETSFVQLQNS